LGAGVVLWPNFPFVKMIILSQVFNGLLLPVVMIFMLKLINKHELMGEHTNSTWFNWAAWITATIVIVLSLVYMGNQVHDIWKQIHSGAASG
jgi:Mn2+/Fe2+ NRAMP family transporter